MPTKPKIVTLTNSAVEVLNAIRNNATNNYRDYVPYATNDADSIREIGAVIMDNPTLQNEFLNALVNRIGKVLVTSKTYENPWAIFKKGMLEFGETIEDIFVRLAKPHQFDEVEAQSKIFQREIPDVRVAYHIMNYQKFYKVTIEEDRLRQAFLSWGGITELITYIVDSMYTGANYDEFQTMKYMLARHILNGRLYPVQVDAVSDANASKIVRKIKSISNDLSFMKARYNIAGVETKSDKNEQYVIMNTDFDATVDVNVLASAFNMDKVQFMANRVLVDSFGDIDVARLDELFDGDDTYHQLTTDELNALKEIPCVLVDKNWFMIFDNLTQFRQQDNSEGLYWNYWYHVWKTFSVSPFANAIVFVPEAPSITSVEVTPATATAGAGQSVALSATVTTVGFAPKTVNWSVPTGAKATVDKAGNVKIADDAVSESTITVTATSTFDTSKTDTCVITIA